jgi:heptosyltransferase-1
MRVLIIKMSSMGDIIHALPALTDAAKAIPGIQFDWVAEEAFAEIPSLHPQVDRVIPISVRRWRKDPWQAIKSGAVKRLMGQLRERHYDLIIDAQSSIKSAIITRFTRGTRCGLDRHSARELFASLAYQRTYFVERKQHAIPRLRKLFAQALGYSFTDNPLDYAIDRSRLAPAPIALPEKYMVFLHSTSWVTKCWPEAYWQALIAQVTAAGFHVLLPWGSAEEQARALRLAGDNPMAQVPPRFKLAEIATVLMHAKAAVCTDTGLGHLSAALDVPAISLYGPTSPALVGTLGTAQVHLCAEFSCAPCRQKQCTYKEPSEQQPACFTTIPPGKVWVALQKLV